MKYDDAEYLFLNFETERDNNDAGTHIGMYLAWALLRGMGGGHFSEPAAAGHLQRLKAREITGADVLWDRCDGKLTDDDFDPIGNAFTAAYYEKQFVRDYERLFQRDFVDTGHPTDDFCSVPDTWDNFARMVAVLDQRFAQWQKSRPQPAAPAAPASLELLPIDEPPAGDPGKPDTAGRGVATEAIRQSVTPSAMPAARRVPAVPPAEAPDRSDADVIGVVATAIGASALFILLLMVGSLSGAPFRNAAMVFAAVGAFGTWRLSAGMGHGPLRRLLLTLCAAVPVFGSFACMLMLKWRWLG